MTCNKLRTVNDVGFSPLSVKTQKKKFRVKSRLISFVLLALAAGVFLHRPAVVHAQTPPAAEPDSSAAPPGFNPVDSAPGIQLFRKDYANGSPDYVQVIQLDIGAEVRLLHGSITEARPTHGSYGGPDPRFTSLPIQTYWRNVAQIEKNLFCVINGSFFYMPEYPTRLAFPLKVGGRLLSEGWGIKTYIDQKLILELWPGRADIQQLSKESLYDSMAPNILGGLTEDANKRAKYAVGRTFLGLDDRDGDGAAETMLILSTLTARQVGAAAVLREFGADKIMMLDGGGSTQLLCRNGHYIRSDRPVPQALAIIAARPPELNAEVVRRPDWQIVLQGQRIPIEFEIRNTGVISWTALDGRLFIDPSPLGSAEWLPIHKTIEPGGVTLLSDSISPPLDQPGAYLVEIAWGVRSGGKSFKGAPIQAPTIILPLQLAERQAELETNLETWKTQPEADIQTLAVNWIDAHTPPTQDAPAEAANLSGTSAPVFASGRNRSADVIWIPIIMFPIMLIIGFLVGKRNGSA